MDSTITISKKVIEQALVTALGAELAKLGVKHLQCITAKEGAKLLKVTPQGFRQIAKEYYDFGPRRTRWSLAEIEGLIEGRRVRAARRKG